MAYYNVCPRCGGNLDPGEKCDCLEEQKKKEQIVKNLIKQESSGQFAFDLVGGNDNEKKIAI